MGRIGRLPPDLANQIAAGEVVERPASIVKELAENAIDAGARRLKIHVELGGKKQVRVEDDGEGMAPEDARLAIERHATSKIRHADDLGAIRTLGFRGEALPSIASVSHFVLRTRARGSASGTEIRVNAGAVASVVEVGMAEGTIVEVGDVFYNLPARRKFLKSDAGEAAQVTRIVTQLALGYPEIGFTLTSGGRTALQCPPAASLRDRLYQLYGERDDLVEVGRDAGGIRLTGYVAALAETGAAGTPSGGPARGPQNVFVNRRIVKDRTIAHAIIDAYSQASIKERSPEVHLFLEMPASALDVNVHPTKAEVRFRDQPLVHEVVRRALRDALGQGGAPQLQLQPERAASEAGVRVAAAIPGVLGGGVFPNRWRPEGAGLDAGALRAGVPGARAPGSGVSGATATGAGMPELRPLIPLGQFRDTFIIAVDDEGIAIVDQHVAHERVLFERVMRQLTAGRLESQRLLMPVVIDLAPDACQTLAARTVQLEAFGYEIERFGEGAIKVAAVPALLGAEDSARALRALAADLDGLDRGAEVQDALQRIAATTSCHAAVKAHDRLTYEKMAHILDELRATAYSTVCPHGRPVMLRLTRREIEKNFDRI
ncbi:MAG: DNA mismatch repair endonuclease MutL [Acidobacteria bacterium]|nr:DNA mismatch repair endonuclease MutL [Acidobacteriota bacterium]